MRIQNSSGAGQRMDRPGCIESDSPCTDRVRRFMRLMGAPVVMMLAIAGCGSGTGTTNEPVSPAVSPAVSVNSGNDLLELRIGTNDLADAPSAFAILEFARHVDELSGGSIVVEPVWRAAGDPAPDDWDQAVAAKVIAGDLDLGLIPTAAWDTEQVTSLRALNAPFLVVSEELVAVILSGDLAGDLMAGLDDVGVTGLGLLPEGLRYVFAYGDALTSPSDFTGATIRSPRSDTVYSVFQSLGATADDPQSSEFSEQASDGTLAGVESSFARAPGLPGGPTQAVGNLALFPKVNALVINDATFSSLTTAQQSVLSNAARLTLDLMLSDAPGENVLAAEYCASGGTVVTVGDTELAAFAAAVAPVYSELETDPTTRDLIDRIRTLALDLPARTPIAPCAGEPDTIASAFDGAIIPSGTYERTITTPDGADLDPTIVADLLGPAGELTTELVIEPDAWTLYLLDADGGREVGDLGTYGYDADGRWVTVSRSGGCAGCIVGFDWSIDGDELMLTLAEVDDHSIYDDAVRLMGEGNYRATSSGSATTTSASVSSTYEVNGHTLTLECQGGGSPTVILEGGLGASLNAMAELRTRLASQNRTCAYGRAIVTAVRTLGDANQDLHDLLAAANLQSPFVIVGQSIGGDLAQMYARTFPDDVVGVVSMNSGPPCPPWLEALAPLVDADFLAGEQNFCSDTGGGDRFDQIASYAQAQAAAAPPDIPFELLISTVDADWCLPGAGPPEPFASQEQCHAANAIHVELARDLAAAWPRGEVTLIDAPHEVFATRLDAVVDMVRAVISRS